MDITPILDIYMMIFGEPILAGLAISFVLSAIMIRLGASFDQIILIAIPFLSAIVLGTSTLIPQSIRVAAALVVAVLLAFALAKLTQRY